VKVFRRFERKTVIDAYIEKLIRVITRVLLTISAAVLVMMMLLTAVDVVMRYIFKLPIPGAFELAEYMMAFIVPFAIAYCAGQKGHVSVELFYNKFPEFLKITLRIFMSVLIFLFASLMTWQNILHIGETYGDRLASAVLLIPTYPFIIPVFIGLGVYALVVLLRLFHSPLSARSK
jgi:TRAP-type C4-dicarboxylate transport system permease small subunit